VEVGSEMSCRRCGDCCKQVVFRVPTEGSTLFWRLHGLEVFDVGDVEVVRIHDKCEWFDGETTSCKNYERRPSICKDFLCDKAKE